jgi:hypothetical protein
MVDRFSSTETVQWNQGAYDDGYEARCVHGAPITACPNEDTIGRFAARSWRAGWADADMDFIARK